MHAVINLIGAVHHQARRLFDARIRAGGAPCNHQSDALDGGHLLSQLIVQLARDGAALLFDAVLNGLREFAVFGQRQRCRTGLALGLDAVLHRLRHVVKGSANLAPFASGQIGQARAVVAGCHLAQAADDLVQRLQSPAHHGVDQCIAQKKAGQHHPQHRAQVIPTIEHRARGVGPQHQSPGGQADLLRLQRWRDDAGVPKRRLAPNLVNRGRRTENKIVLVIAQLDFVGPNATDLAQKFGHAGQPAGAVHPLHAREQLRRHHIGAQHLVMHTAPRVVDLQTNEHGRKHRHQGGDDQIDLKAKTHGYFVCQNLLSRSRTLAGPSKRLIIPSNVPRQDRRWQRHGVGPTIHENHEDRFRHFLM